MLQALNRIKIFFFRPYHHTAHISAALEWLDPVQDMKGVCFDANLSLDLYFPAIRVHTVDVDRSLWSHKAHSELEEIEWEMYCKDYNFAPYDWIRESVHQHFQDWKYPSLELNFDAEGDVEMLED